MTLIYCLSSCLHAYDLFDFLEQGGVLSGFLERVVDDLTAVSTLPAGWSEANHPCSLLR